jgi:hypothetical protein
VPKEPGADALKRKHFPANDRSRIANAVTASVAAVFDIGQLGRPVQTDRGMIYTEGGGGFNPREKAAETAWALALDKLSVDARHSANLCFPCCV